MHDNDGQVTPVSQAFSVWTLEGLSTRTGELEALLQLATDYGEFKGETGNALAAILRLIHQLQDETVKAIALYKQAPGAIGYDRKQEQASPALKTLTEKEWFMVDLFRGMSESQQETVFNLMLIVGGDS